MTTSGFRERLAARQEEIRSLACIGLDPLPEKLPPHLQGVTVGQMAGDVAYWMKAIVDATAEYACMFKLQRAHWEAIRGGVEAMQKVIKHIKEQHPTIPAFLDGKRGDIGRTQERYRVAHFELDCADGLNFSPYMGKDCMEYLIDPDAPEHALVNLCYTSNESGRQMQDALMQDGNPYWEFVARCTLEWAEELDVVENTGLVMAAAYEKPKGSGTIYSDHLKRAREIVGDKLWFLIPGVGAQGGYVEETVQTAYRGPGTIAINSSSGVTNASQGEDCAEAAATKARELAEQTYQAIPTTAV